MATKKGDRSTVVPRPTSSKPQKTVVRRASKGPAKGKTPKLYDWGDGKGKRHTIPQGRHEGNVAKRQQAIQDQKTNDYVAAAQRLRFGSQEASLNQQGQAIPSWFQQYQNRLQQATAASQGYYAGLQAQGQAMQAQQGQTANLGPGVSADVQAQNQLAAQSRQGMASQFNQALGGASGAENAFLQNQGVVAGASQLGAQLQNSQARQQLMSDKGAYGVQAKSDYESALASAAQKQQENDLAAAALNVKGQAEQNDLTIAKGTLREKARTRRTNAKVARTRLTIQERSEQRRLEAQAREGRLNRQNQVRLQRLRDKAKTAGGGAPVTATEARKGRITFRQAVDNVERHKTVGDKALYEALVDNGYDPAIARGAVQLVRKGTVGPKTQQQLRDDYGVTVKKQKRRPQKQYTPNQPVSEHTYGR